MKRNIVTYICIQLVLFTIGSGSAADKKRSSRPIGPYKLVFKQVFNCNSAQNKKFHLDTNLIHRGNTTILFGNVTNEIPFDDTLFLEMRLSLKESLGNWKEDVFIHKAPKACSSFKSVMGNAWNPYWRGMGFKNTECPLPQGVFIGRGVDMSIFMDTNFPKSFIYGTYKFHIFVSRKNEIWGCLIYIIEFKRP